MGKRPAAKEPEQSVKKDHDSSEPDGDEPGAGEKDEAVKKRPAGQGSTGGSGEGRVRSKSIDMLT